MAFLFLPILKFWTILYDPAEDSNPFLFELAVGILARMLSITFESLICTFSIISHTFFGRLLSLILNDSNTSKNIGKKT